MTAGEAAALALALVVAVVALLTYDATPEPACRPVVVRHVEAPDAVRLVCP